MSAAAAPAAHLGQLEDEPDPPGRHRRGAEAGVQPRTGSSSGRDRAVDVSVHPPFTALRSVQTLLDADDIPIFLGAQDVYWEERGAYTGEISPPCWPSSAWPM